MVFAVRYLRRGRHGKAEEDFLKMRGIHYDCFTARIERLTSLVVKNGIYKHNFGGSWTDYVMNEPISN